MVSVVIALPNRGRSGSLGTTGILSAPSRGFCSMPMVHQWEPCSPQLGGKSQDYIERFKISGHNRYLPSPGRYA